MTHYCCGGTGNFRWRSFVVRNFAACSWLSLAHLKISPIYFSTGSSYAGCSLEPPTVLEFSFLLEWNPSFLFHHWTHCTIPMSVRPAIAWKVISISFLSVAFLQRIGNTSQIAYTPHKHRKRQLEIVVVHVPPRRRNTHVICIKRRDVWIHCLWEKRNIFRLVFIYLKSFYLGAMLWNLKFKIWISKSVGLLEIIGLFFNINIKISLNILQPFSLTQLKN